MVKNLSIVKNFKFIFFKRVRDPDKFVFGVQGEVGRKVPKSDRQARGTISDGVGVDCSNIVEKTIGRQGIYRIYKFRQFLDRSHPTLNKIPLVSFEADS